MNKIFGARIDGPAAAGLLVFRLAFGIGIILHGWDKVRNGGPSHWADQMGPLAAIPHPLQAAATFVEVGAGAAMILGLLTPPAMFVLAVNMAVALYLGHPGESYVSLDRPFKPTYEVAAHYLLAAGVLLLTGPGVLSLDHLIFGRRRQREPAVETLPVP